MFLHYTHVKTTSPVKGVGAVHVKCKYVSVRVLRVMAFCINVYTIKSKEEIYCCVRMHDNIT